MSLNEEVEKEFREEAEYLTTSDIKEEPKEDLVVHTEEDYDYTIPEDVDQTVSQMQDYDVHVKTMNEKISYVRDLDDIAETVLAQESISREMAKDVNDVYHHLYEEVATDKEFTEAPTSVNYQATVEYMKKEREKHFEESVTIQETYIRNTLERVKCTAHSLLETIIPSLVQQLEYLKDEAKEDLSDLQEDPKKWLAYTKVPEGEEPKLVNLAEVPITSTPWVDTYQLPEESPGPGEDELKLYEASLTEDTKAFISTSLRESDLELTPTAMSYKDILTYFSVGTAIGYLEGYTRRISDIISTDIPVIEEVLQKRLDDLITLEKTHERVKWAFNDLFKYDIICNEFSNFLVAAKSIMEYFDD